MGILGIDLGTTNSLIAYYDEEGAHLIPNKLGEYLTPSVIGSGETGEIYIGRLAQQRLITHPEETAALFKRDMGTEKKYTIGNKDYLPEELSALMIRSLIQDAEEYLGNKPEEVIISVPAYFNDIQRKATKRAGELAGVKAERLINEPTGAAIAYGIQGEKQHTKYLVIDLGGGTYDISVLEMSGNIMEVHAVAGDNYLGGEDFTKVLEGIFLKQFQLKYNDLDPLEKAMLRKQAEQGKRQVGQSGKCILNCKAGGQYKELEITEKQYEEACSSLLQRMRKPIERALRDSSVKVDEIDRIVLVGGGTKLPLVKQFLGRVFKKFPEFSINPEEVVALGSALQGAMKERDEGIKEVILTDVCPHTLGTNISVMKEEGIYETGHYLPVIERNTVVPVSRTKRLYTLYDNQRMVKVKILQGESRKVENNILLSEISIPVPSGKKGEEAIDIRFTYDINSLLEVEVEAVSTGKKKKEIIEQNSGHMTGEEIKQRLNELEKLKVHPRDEQENKLLILRAERLYEEQTGEARREIGKYLQEFEQAMENQEKNTVNKAARLLKEHLDVLEEDWM